ncbi:MAG: hypothetical protein K0R18_481 [Bacillales bacterium]|jgi:hypothetical protein|nr:hypothetical protein [Bacillales bacterium]
MNELFMALIQDLAYALVTVGVGFLIAFLKKKIGVENMKKIQEQSHLIKQIVEMGVKYAEQTFESGEKLDHAIEWIITTLASKGIKVEEKEIRGLVEATIRELKDQFGEEWGKATSKKEESKDVTINI